MNVYNVMKGVVFVLSQVLNALNVTRIHNTPTILQILIHAQVYVSRNIIYIRINALNVIKIA